MSPLGRPPQAWGACLRGAAGRHPSRRTVLVVVTRKSQSSHPSRLASVQMALLSHGTWEVEMGFEVVIGINASEERVWAALTSNTGPTGSPL
jgi:hypothetical protein